MAKERECLCCSTKYTFCPNCRNAKDFPAWKTEFDEESCREVFNAVSGYNMGIIPAKDVIGVLKKYNITDVSKYKKSIRNKLNEILEEEAINEKSAEPVKSEIPMKKYDNKKYNNNK